MSAKYSLMMRTLLALAVVLLAFSGPAHAQGFKWWQDESFQKRLGLTAEQSRRIDNVFQSAQPELRRSKRQLDALEEELSRLVAGADEAALVRQVDRVEGMRSELNKARTLMLLRIQRILSPEQQTTLATLHNERDQQRRSRGNRH